MLRLQKPQMPSEIFERVPVSQRALKGGGTRARVRHKNGVEPARLIQVALQTGERDQHGADFRLRPQRELAERSFGYSEANALPHIFLAAVQGLQRNLRGFLGAEHDSITGLR